MKKVGFKKGAASFYMVAFSTLLLVIIATSFALVIVANVVRSSNDDLSQSAYDAAMAGVEDALLAYKTYMDCKASGASAGGTLSSGDMVTCQDILFWVTKAPDCFMTARILGRIGKNDEGEEVAVGDSTMNQAYTCVKFQQDDESYVAKLEPKLPESTINVEFDEASAMANAKTLTMRWGGVSDDDSAVKFGGNMFSSDGKMKFPTYGDFSNNGADTNILPVVSLRILQVSDNPSFADVLDAASDDGKSNRAMAYFVPVNDSSSEVVGAVRLEGNRLNAADFAATNSGSVGESSNLPFLVKCDDDTSGREYPCEVTVELPELLGKKVRAELIVSVASVYGNAGEVEIEFRDELDRTINVKNGNAVVDSTGRAGDRYRRIRAKLQSDNVVSSGVTSALYLHKNASVVKKKVVGM